MVHIFGIHLVFQGAKTKIKPCYWRK